MKRHNLDKFELSQAYLFFHDKLEKANFFLEQICDTVDEDLDSRIVQTLLAQPVSDGGQWDMVYNLVNKYGLVPQVLYPDSFNAQSSSAINSLITTKLREDGLKLALNLLFLYSPFSFPPLSLLFSFPADPRRLQCNRVRRHEIHPHQHTHCRGR